MQNRTISIASILIQETGRYNNQVSRPYMSTGNAEALDMLTRRIEDTSRGTDLARVGGGLVSGLSGYLVAPQASWEKELAIPNGWNEQRLRFGMEVHITDAFATEIYYIQGYSEYNAVSLQDTIDPNLVFYINSMTRLNRGRDYNGLGSAGFRDIVTEATQVVNGPMQAQSAGSNDLYCLRPEDIFVGIQSSHYAGALHTLNEGSVIDSRINLAGDVVRSRRTNAIPSNYLGSVIETHRTASTLADFGGGTDDIYSRAIANSHEAGPYENSFIRRLSDLHGMQNTTYFTLNDLVTIDPTVMSRLDYAPVDNIGLLADPNNQDGWYAPTLETQLATIVASAVPSMMIAHMFVQVAFTCTNMTIGGVPDFRVIGGRGVSDVDLRPYYQTFISRFLSELWADLTLNNSRPIHILVNADLYGDTNIEISIEGAPPVPFVAPTFADAITAPIVTTNQNNYHGLITGIEEIMQHCAPSNTMSSLSSMVSINV